MGRPRPSPRAPRTPRWPWFSSASAWCSCSRWTAHSSGFRSSRSVSRFSQWESRRAKRRPGRTSRVPAIRQPRNRVKDQARVSERGRLRDLATERVITPAAPNPSARAVANAGSRPVRPSSPVAGGVTQSVTHSASGAMTTPTSMAPSVSADADSGIASDPTMRITEAATIRAPRLTRAPRVPVRDVPRHGLARAARPALRSFAAVTEPEAPPQGRWRPIGPIEPTVSPTP